MGIENNIYNGLYVWIYLHGVKCIIIITIYNTQLTHTLCEQNIFIQKNEKKNKKNTNIPNTIS